MKGERRVILPTLHADQVRAYRKFQASPLFALRAGRRWGKTDFGKTLACDSVTKGFPVGWFAPDYKISSEAYNEILDILEPIRRQSSKVEGVIRSITGGRVDFWTLDNERAGRSRKYKLVLIDEGAFTKSNMMDIWEQSIKPTLLDLGGRAVVMSNTNGNDPTNFLWQVCNEPKHGFQEYHAPTEANPLLPLRLAGENLEDHAARRAAIFDKLRAENHPLVYAQEYEAKFVDWSGVAFFALDKLLHGDPPTGVEYPRNCDYVFAIVDTASKTEIGNDGTAIVYYAFNRSSVTPLTILDWDYIQVEGDLLEAYLPGVFDRLNALAGQCGARMGSAGAFIEDKDAGVVLLQRGARLGWPVTAIPSDLTALGKDGRALNVSSYHYTGKVKMSQVAHDKVATFKGVTRNHLESQIAGFRVSDPKARSRADDLLDCYTYGLAVSLGGSGGF